MGHPEMDVEQNLPPLPSMFPTHVSYANWRNKGHSRTYAKAIVQFQKNMQEVVEALSLPSDLACRMTPLPFLTRNGEAGGPLEITFHISSDSRSGQCYLLHDEGLCPQWKLFADVLGRFGDGFGEPSVILKFDHIQMTMSVMMDILWVAFESKVVESLTLKSNELGPDEIGSLASFIERAYVKKLQINGSNIDNAESASHLSRAIAKNGNISVFNVEDCGIGRNSGVLSAIANVMKCVSKVFLSRNDIGSDGAKIIADMLADNMMEKELYLNNNELEDKDMRLFANALRTNTNLRKLYLNKCDGSGLGKRALAKALFDRTSLVTAFNSNHYCRVFIDDGHCVDRLNDGKTPADNRFSKLKRFVYKEGDGSLNTACLDNVPTEFSSVALSIVLKCSNGKKKQLNSIFELLTKRPELLAYGSGGRLPKKFRKRKRVIGSKKKKKKQAKVIQNEYS
ncbi:predicted protein [Thalassiosira pseudonana CCMP1335]|uniref:Uncharacterized protein n=1 Tax=Thalassiosira pseudonana TaxID=35128 RepID=B8LCJ7_THAPS|nr:predicted protein [Thalassiosira pseudonana CCMP1335]EED86996.1 predicted protein [Thalassiosira pseudonana CCMP1335]